MIKSVRVDVQIKELLRLAQLEGSVVFAVCFQATHVKNARPGACLEIRVRQGRPLRKRE